MCEHSSGCIQTGAHDMRIIPCIWTKIIKDHINQSFHAFGYDMINLPWRVLSYNLKEKKNISRHVTMISRFPMSIVFVRTSFIFIFSLQACVVQKRYASVHTSTAPKPKVGPLNQSQVPRRWLTLVWLNIFRPFVSSRPGDRRNIQVSGTRASTTEKKINGSRVLFGQ